MNPKLFKTHELEAATLIKEGVINGMVEPEEGATFTVVALINQTSVGATLQITIPITSSSIIKMKMMMVTI